METKIWLINVLNAPFHIDISDISDHRMTWVQVYFHWSRTVHFISEMPNMINDSIESRVMVNSEKN